MDQGKENITMKKPLAMLLALTMAFTMAGCAGGSSTESRDSTASEGHCRS